MSHWFKIKTQFKNKEAIRKAARSMGYLCRQHGKCRGYRGQETRCDLVIPLPGQYDIGFNKQPDGSYELVADFWQDHISKYLANPAVLDEAKKNYKRKLEEEGYEAAEQYINEAKISKFMQEYNKFAVQGLCAQQGFQYLESVQEDGTIVLEIMEPQI